jgi:F0F1-type ATP synthase assembly protein I
VQGIFDDENDDAADTGLADDGGVPEEPVVLSSYTPPTQGEVIRQTGLAWSAGIAFGGAIIVMSLLGWFADLVFGSAPWGIVGGVILGSIIGFLQFFRISSQIFKKDDSVPAEHPLMSSAEHTEVRRDRFDG